MGCNGPSTPIWSYLRPASCSVAACAHSAADLKFLQRLQQAHEGTSNRKAALESRRASAPLLPKFVSEGAAMYHELRKRGTSTQSRRADWFGFVLLATLMVSL